MENDLVTTEEAAALIGVTVSRVWVLIRCNRFPGAKLYGRAWLIPRSEVLAHERRRAGRPKKGAKRD